MSEQTYMNEGIDSWNSFMLLYNSALQGLTEFAWRNAHSKIFGYIDKYYAPFMRIEHGKFRNKDLREISHDNNDTDNLVPSTVRWMYL